MYHRCFFKSSLLRKRKKEKNVILKNSGKSLTISNSECNSPFLNMQEAGGYGTGLLAFLNPYCTVQELLHCIRGTVNLFLKTCESLANDLSLNSKLPKSPLLTEKK